MLSVSTRWLSLYRVRVSGLPFNASPCSVLSAFGPLEPLEFSPIRSETGKDLGQGFVSFDSIDLAIAAVERLNGKFISNRRVTVACDFRGPRVVEELTIPRQPRARRLIKEVRDKAVGAKWPTEPVMASTNESRMLRRYKTGGLPRSHDRQR
jgi:hypothetical protein